jgi:hypothetical protein
MACALACFGLAGCGVGQSDATYWAHLDRNDAGATTDDAGDPGAPIGGGPPTGCSLAVTVTTVTANGDYAPENVGAIWITDAHDEFVKTLAEWGSIRRKYLLAWKASSALDTVDAVTSATLSHHRQHAVLWNCADTSESVVPDGSYEVHFEFTEQDSNVLGDPPPGPFYEVEIDKGTKPFALSPRDRPNFVGVRLAFAPP